MLYRKILIKLTYKDLEKDVNQLEKYIGKKCRFETRWWEVVEDAKIDKYDWKIVLLHNENTKYWITGLEGEYKNAFVVTTKKGKFNWDVDWIEIFEEPEFTEWEWILVRDEEDEKWVKRIFLHRDKKWHFITIVHGDEKRYLRWKEYGTCIWKQGKKIDIVKIKTVDWQIIEVEKNKLEELGFKFVTK